MEEAMNFENIDYIAELKQKNQRAMDIVINKYSKLLYKVIYSVLGQYKDEGQIEECLSDVFLSIWNNSHKFLGDESRFKSWICVIAKYKAIDYSRKKLKFENDNDEYYLAIPQYDGLYRLDMKNAKTINFN
jgi:RNA polymerase sigma-70 factor (ECF subfamily)